MNDSMLIAGAVIIFFCILLWAIMRNGDYEQQRFLSAGVYEVGVEIPPGRCDLVAASGSGNFIIKNKKANAWTIGNPIGVTSGAMPGRFRNITLNRGDLLEINGTVVIMLSPPMPILDLEEETLGPGIYKFGVDVPPAKYNFEVASGSGEIYLVEVGQDTYNMFQQMAKGHSMHPSSFENVLCSRRYEIWVNGNLQLKLKRSKHQPLVIGTQKGL